MKTNLNITKEQFKQGLIEAGIVNGDTLYIASSLTTMGLMTNPLETILESIQSVIGKEGTIVVPTFNFDFCKDEDFNLKKTPSKVGIFTEFIRNNPDAKRTYSPPFHTVAAIGKRADEISNICSLTSFGKQSVFQYLYEINAKYLLIGTDYHNGVVHFHWLEEIFEVPYRYWKKFEGNIVIDKDIFQKVFFMYVRKNNEKLNFQPSGELFEASGHVKKSKVGLCTLRSFQINDFYNFFEPLIIRDPYILLDQKTIAKDKKNIIKRIDHIAIVSKYSNKIKKLLSDINLTTIYEGIVPEISVNCQYFEGLNTFIEIVNPIDDKSRVANYYHKNSSSPIHHIAFEVDNIDDAIIFFKQKGYHVLDGEIYLSPVPYQRVVFLAPVYTGGLLIELVSNDAITNPKYKEI